MKCLGRDNLRGEKTLNLIWDWNLVLFQMPDASYLILINGQAIHTLEIKVHEQEEDEKKKEGNVIFR